MSNIPKTTVAITAFGHTSGYQYIRPKADKLIDAAQFINLIVTAPTLEEAKARLSKHTLSWDYYSNWMDGQRDIATRLSANKKLRKRIKAAPPNIVNYLQGIKLSQRLIQIDVDLAKYPLYSTKWRAKHETYLDTFDRLKKADPDYTTLFLETPSARGYTLTPFIERLAETGYFLALAYVAFAHIEISFDDSLTEEKRDEHFHIGFDYLDKACARGSDDAIITMGDIYRRMLDESDNDPKGAQKVYLSMIKHYDLATRRGSPNAKTKLGNALLSSQTKKDPKTGIYHGMVAQVEPALEFLTKAAAEDSTFAYFYLGTHYYKSSKLNRAIEYFEKAAQNEHINSMRELDTLYAEKAKQSKPQNAAQLRIKAAENMYMMGHLYETGHCMSGEPNFKEAQTCYLKSLRMDLGDQSTPQIKSALALSRFASEGKELPAPNARLAFAYLKKAADLGDMSATIQIACHYIQPNDPTLKEDWNQGRLYLDKITQSKHTLSESDSALISETIQKCIEQTDHQAESETQDPFNRYLHLNEFILDLAKVIRATEIIIAAFKTIGFLHAYTIFDKTKAISYYEQAVSLGDLNAYLDIGFVALNDSDPNYLPNISYAMQAFKTGVKKGLDLTEDTISSIKAQLFTYEDKPEMKEAFDKAIYYDIKFLMDYNWLERTFFSGTRASSQDQNKIPLYIQCLETETVLDADHIKDLLSGFKRCYAESCAHAT